ncbi:MAG: sugar phosphate isomerase/epimerase family protein [Phycisphaerae bacterium]
MSMPVVGAQLYTCRQFTKTTEGALDTIRKVADIGYPSIQISGFGDVDLNEVAKLTEDLGLEVAATHVKWDRFLNELEEVIGEHKLLKCEHPAIGGLPGEYHTADGVKRFIEELTPIAERLGEEGMDFSYHNHNQELVRVGEKTWLAMLYEQASPEILKAEIDTYWIQAGGGDPAAWIRKCAGREPLVHFKDMSITADREIRMAEIGEGNLNWPEIIDACVEGGVDYALVEQDNCYERDPFESLAISYRNLREMGLK